MERSRQGRKVRGWQRGRLAQAEPLDRLRRQHLGEDAALERAVAGLDLDGNFAGGVAWIADEQINLLADLAGAQTDFLKRLPRCLRVGAEHNVRLIRTQLDRHGHLEMIVPASQVRLDEKSSRRRPTKAVLAGEQTNVEA